MTTTPIDNTSITTDFNVDELTEGTLTGKGVFDVLLQTLRLHLDREFNSNRITGTAYATVYSQAITAFLTQAAQYAISKAKLPLELQLLQEQINLTQKQQNQITAAIRQTDYVTDYQLPSEVANKTKQTEILAYELTNIKPVELGIAQQDLALKTAQADLVEYDLTTLKPQELALLQQQVAVQLYTVQTRMPAEVANIQAETALKAYDLTDIKPTEKAQITQQTSNLISQKEQTVAETSRVLYEVNYRLPEEVTLIKHNQDQVLAQTNKIITETEEAIQRIEELVPSQIALINMQKAQVTAQTAQITYTTSYVLPSQVSLTNAQTSSATAQTALYNQKTVTELAQTTSTPASGSVMGVQNDLMATQKASYLRDAEQKAAKMLIDTWNIRMNTHPTDTNFNDSNKLADGYIGSAVGKMLNGIGV